MPGPSSRPLRRRRRSADCKRYQAFSAPSNTRTTLWPARRSDAARCSLRVLQRRLPEARTTTDSRSSVPRKPIFKVARQADFTRHGKLRLVPGQLALQKIEVNRRLIQIQRKRNHLDFYQPQSCVEALTHLIGGVDRGPGQIRGRERNHQIELGGVLRLLDDFKPEICFLSHGNHPVAG